MRLYDAHNHLASAELYDIRHEFEDTFKQIGLTKTVINGTEPNDWPSVLGYTSTKSWSIPAIGLHPWKVRDAAPDWQDSFLEAIDQGAKAIGEIGLDQRIETPEIEKQIVAFAWQLEQASQRNLPVSIHCLKATDALMRVVRNSTLPENGIHLHAYSGPSNLIPELVEMGAYFSFNGGQLKPNAKKVRDLIVATPLDRILIETDAPAMLTAPQLRKYTFKQAQHTHLNHPANLFPSYEAIASIKGIPLEALVACVEENFLSYFQADNETRP